MLTRRSLTLSRHQTPLDSAVVRREALEQRVQADQLLEQAEQRAQSIIRDAQDTAQTLRQHAAEEARAEVWRQAEGVLGAWQQQREAMWEAIIEHADGVLQRALQQLLGEVPDSARIQGVLRQLAACQRHDEAAVVHCHPDWLDRVSARLASTQDCQWSVRADPLLASDTLCLRSDQGSFVLGWQALERVVWPGENLTPH
ncbi:type III secretion system stator protein SctL [Pseudomonas fluorescens]|uniref:Type III secretion system stator protein SctL n=1 Tax=Pseudomonas fluorescens TaxID=294 RepID=A0A944DLF4_PSEFL|nr:type III secretion system stator protein SctL [Pseudomonas fluorescens]MBT2298554.1 type III secretion system stator protein SctL [Pseudomonas fluorescens]MBT2310079.1 type III secretion system stator protein SctL [Pseudomonas fluorescens]MBT2311103.1 type III secretion system stator protein SctL [Pseudomonas fluorescens]MBT2319962.1 type III secretion system stator protein SctL [Pseudomonas fluorescens]MBT2329010.1 type III secretion system stator protein SctL [Pseudomonas fluorescens]